MNSNTLYTYQMIGLLKINLISPLEDFTGCQKYPIQGIFRVIKFCILASLKVLSWQKYCFTKILVPPLIMVQFKKFKLFLKKFAKSYRTRDFVDPQYLNLCIIVIDISLSSETFPYHKP